MVGVTVRLIREAAARAVDLGMRRNLLSTVVTGVLALLLAAGTVVGVVSAVSSSSDDRVPDASSTAPVYGTP